MRWVSKTTHIMNTAQAIIMSMLKKAAVPPSAMASPNGHDSVVTEDISATATHSAVAEHTSLTDPAVAVHTGPTDSAVAEHTGPTAVAASTIANDPSSYTGLAASTTTLAVFGGPDGVP